MRRVPEPELMDDPEQALAYAMADFSEPDSQFMSLFREEFGRDLKGFVLDLGCGPGNISFRFAREYKECIVHAIDGSEPMIGIAENRLATEPELKERLFFFKGVLPRINPPQEFYDIIISNSLLHHLHEPDACWQTIKRFSKRGTIIFIRDLKRPSSEDEARRIVERYSGGEPEILKRDFYNSLLAAFTVDEIEDQLRITGLKNLYVREVSDRHLVVSGFM